MLYKGEGGVVNARKWDGTAWGHIQIEYFVGLDQTIGTSSISEPKVLLFAQANNTVALYPGDYVIKAKDGSLSSAKGKEFEGKYKKL